MIKANLSVIGHQAMWSIIKMKYKKITLDSFIMTVIPR